MVDPSRNAIHSFVEVLLSGFARMPGVLLLPYKLRLQPVDVDEVARRLVEVMVGEPGGMLPDFGGPEDKDMKRLATAWLAARHSRRRMFNLPLPFKFARQVADGALLCPDHRDGVVTFAQHHAERYP